MWSCIYVKMHQVFAAPMVCSMSISTILWNANNLRHYTLSIYLHFLEVNILGVSWGLESCDCCEVFGLFV
jgi:hypothetical protein